MNKSKLSLIGKLLKIVSPLFLIMLNTIIMGVIGFICSTGIPVLGGVGLLIYLGEIQNITYSQVFGIAVAFAVLRGILRYAEQYSGHYIAFRVLAIIRDRIFTVLRKLAPAKLEGKDKGNLITLITTDIAVGGICCPYDSPCMHSIFYGYNHTFYSRALQYSSYDHTPCWLSCDINIYSKTYHKTGRRKWEKIQRRFCKSYKLCT